MKIEGYYFITDSSLSRAGNKSDVKAALSAGVGIIQYREKTADTRKMLKEAQALRKICRDAIFLINDRVDIALAVNADGVHIGREDIPYSLARKLLGRNKIIGVTAHNIREAKKAEEIGAYYIGVSPIFKTATKSDAGKPAGVELIRTIKKHMSLPIIAIGGITLANAKEVVEAGADGLSAISAVVAKRDVAREIKKFQALFF